ncbi:hypothetical protein BB559_004659 [Furculomyces boomerangus]|uniref:Peptidase M24 domain-containing protein n=2 Tax=Harpellales TaxID=61421 RepID=A0A2T9YDL1_9FUNG|nr:hypothetical protein BB559_004659 [Furculomyces boomerangus]PVZ98710.1 hypothetical protein BB558_005283 [Smittium angustum]
MDQEAQEKYRYSATIVQNVLELVSSSVHVGSSVHSLCKYGDDLIRANVKTLFKKNKDMEKGISFPTSITINNFIQNFSPPSSEDIIVGNDDLVKIEISAHVDGYIVSLGKTVVAQSPPRACLVDKRANVIAAAYYASEAALRLFSPGKTSTDVTKAIKLVADGFGCSIAEHSYTSQFDRFVISGKKTFPNKQRAEGPIINFEFSAGEVYSIDIIMSTGTGFAKKTSVNPSIYTRNVNKSYQLKLKASRALFSKVCTDHSVFPFLLRETIDDRMRAGLNECVKNQLLIPYAVSSDQNGEYVAQYKVTVFVHHNGPLRLTPVPEEPNVKPAVSIPQESEISVLLKTPVNMVSFASLPKNPEVEFLTSNFNSIVPEIDSEMMVE